MNFKSPNGQYILKQIFYEIAPSDSEYPVYSLKNEDHEVNGKVYPSLRRLYIQSRDLTEYSFATNHLHDWTHWVKLRESNWFQEYYRDWREELEVLMKSNALANVYKKATNPDDKDSLTAAKFILTDGWKPKESKITGPRTKDQIRKEAQNLFTKSKDTDDDYTRLFQ